MTIPPFLIVADRGAVKAFAVEETPRQTRMPRLVATLQVSAAPDKYRNQFTDQAGGFPNGGSAGQGNSIAERLSLRDELEIRAVREVARHIEQLLAQHQPVRWGLAALPEICNTILDLLPAARRDSLMRIVKRDLNTVQAHELIEQFADAEPIPR
jgi:hypothetical protein